MRLLQLQLLRAQLFEVGGNLRREVEVDDHQRRPGFVPARHNQVCKPRPALVLRAVRHHDGVLGQKQQLRSRQPRLVFGVLNDSVCGLLDDLGAKIVALAIFSDPHREAFVVHPRRPGRRFVLPSALHLHDGLFDKTVQDSPRKPRRCALAGRILGVTADVLEGVLFVVRTPNPFKCMRTLNFVRTAAQTN